MGSGWGGEREAVAIPTSPSSKWGGAGGGGDAGGWGSSEPSSAMSGGWGYSETPPATEVGVKDSQVTSPTWGQMVTSSSWGQSETVTSQQSVLETSESKLERDVGKESVQELVDQLVSSSISDQDENSERASTQMEDLNNKEAINSQPSSETSSKIEQLHTGTECEEKAPTTESVNQILALTEVTKARLTVFGPSDLVSKIDEVQMSRFGHRRYFFVVYLSLSCQNAPMYVVQS